MSGPASRLPQVGPVLHATDLKESARTAFPYALFLAALSGGDLHVLHVAAADEPPRSAFPDPGDVWARVGGWLEGGDAAAGGGGGRDAPGVRPEVRRSRDTAGEILEYASEIEAGSVCMGTHARRGLRRLVLGSVAERVIRRSPAPVLTVRRGVEGWGRAGLRRVLVPVDLSEMMAPALAWAGNVAAATGAELRALHVVESAAGAAPAGRRQRIYGAYRDLTKPDARPEEGLQVEMAAGDPVTCICGAAGEEAVDLVVTATHGRSGPSRLVLGSVAESVARRSPCPVLTVSEPPGA